MNLGRSYESLIRRLGSVLPDVNVTRVSTAYDDVLAFAAVHQQLGDEASSLAVDDWTHLTLAEQEQMARAVRCGSDMDAMLAAAIVFGDLTNVALLQELFGKRAEDVSVLWLSSRHASPNLRSWASRLDVGALVGAHALRVYRNELVLHFGQPRTRSATWRHRDPLSRRLSPIHFPGATEASHAQLEALRRRYSHLDRVSAVTEVEPGRHNFWELLEALFYSLPPLRGTAPSSDRSYVDRLAKHGGIRSPTMDEVLETLTRFAQAVVRHVLGGDRPPRPT